MVEPTLFTLCKSAPSQCMWAGASTRMCACFYRDRVEGPQSIIKSQSQGVLGIDCSKNFMGRREEKKEN